MLKKAIERQNQALRRRPAAVAAKKQHGCPNGTLTPVLSSTRQRRPQTVSSTSRRGPTRYTTSASESTQSAPSVISKIPLFDKILIANRGEIACRVIRTCRFLGIKTVAVYSDVESNAQHVKMADEAYLLGPAPSAESYLRADKIIEICKWTGAQAVHPGYGFLSENAAFAESLAREGIEFIGPPASAIVSMGSKSESKNIMLAAGVPCVPGYHGENQDVAFLQQKAQEIGYPVLIKATKGGGGKGMKIVFKDSEFREQLDSAKRESLKSFADDTVLVEKYLQTPRHVEVQVFGDKQGNVVHLYERDCSVQRRHQKIIEEAPAPHLPSDIRADLGVKAVAAAKAVDYVGAGTVEFIMDAETGQFYFMEMNTRLQVEHPVTEMVTGLDLVAWQLEVAAGNPLPLQQKDITCTGHSFEARIYAEDPNNNFLPETGTLTHVKPPQLSPSIRLETGFVSGDEIKVYYDPMIAKLVVHGPDRSAALRLLRYALQQYEVVGPHTNIPFLVSLSSHHAFQAGQVETGFIDKYRSELFPPDSDLSPSTFAQAALFSSMQNALRQPFSNERPSVPWTLLAEKRFGGASSSKQYAFGRHKREQFTTISINNNADTSSATACVTDPTGSSSELALLGTVFEAPSTFSTTTNLGRQRDSIIADAEHPSRLHIFGQEVQTQLDIPVPAWLKALNEADGTAIKSGAATAPTPSRVVAVQCKEGQDVTKGQTLVVLEAMKTEISIRASVDGTIEKVHCGDGQLVKEGEVLVTFKEETDAESKTE